MMKIAILVSMYLPKWLGGAELATKYIAEHLLKGGSEVYILTSQDKGLLREERRGKLFVQRISYPKIKILGVALFWLKLFFSLRKIRPDIIHCQGLQIAPSALLAKKFLGLPYLVYCHGSDVYLPWKFKSLISEQVLKNANAVVALTEDMKKKVEELYNRKIFVIPNGIELKNFKNLSKDIARQKLKLAKEEKFLVFVGTLKQVKGLKYLIEAVKILKGKMPEMRLLIIGEGGEKENLQEQVEKLKLKQNVIFFGKLANEKIPEYMIASDIFVLPSLSEGLPVTVLEAMAAGLPIVATQVGGLPEIVKQGQNGFLVEAKEPEILAQKILTLLSDEKLRNSMSLNNQKEAKKYSWDLIVAKLINLYSLCQK